MSSTGGSSTKRNVEAGETGIAFKRGVPLEMLFDHLAHLVVRNLLIGTGHIEGDDDVEEGVSVLGLE